MKTMWKIPGMKIQWILKSVLIVFTFVARAYSDSDFTWAAKNLEKKLNDSNYDKNVLPKLQRMEPTQVNLQAQILSVDDLDEHKHSFSMRFILRESWNDSRLAEDDNMHNVKEASADEMQQAPVVLLMNEHVQSLKLWTPDTFIINEKEKQMDYVTLKVSLDGHVVRSRKVNLVASCKLTFGWYPYDTHTCSVNFQSYNYDANDIEYTWDSKNNDTKPVQVADEASPPNFKLGAVGSFAYSISSDLGNFSRASLKIFLIRKTHRAFPMLFFPSIALTLVAVLTLWFGSLEIRILVSTIALIGMMIFISLTYSSTIPTVSFLTAGDHYHFLCLNLIFNAVVVNFILYYFHKKAAGNCDGREYSHNNTAEMTELKSNNGGAVVTPDEEKQQESHTKQPQQQQSKFKSFVYKNATMTKKHMPILFLIFNIIFFLVVLIASSGYPKDFTVLNLH